MINVKYDRENLILKMKGHAESNPGGPDVICACATMLMYTLAQNVKFLEDAGVAKDVHIITEEGHAVVSCSPVEEKETLLCVFDTITTGFLMLHGNYPENIKFIEK